MYTKAQKTRIRNIEREGFRKLKEQENINRLIPREDILNSNDFKFKKYSDTGDSGSILLATNKNDKGDKYIVKHDYYDCACNEYMYSKIANKFGIKVAPVKLFVTNNEKIFKSEFVCGTKYLENSDRVGYKYLLDNKDDIKNFEDFYRFLGLESLLLECDGVEILRYEDYIYRIDTAASFTLSDYFIHNLAYDFEKDGINIRKVASRMILDKANLDSEKMLWNWNFNKNCFLKDYGEEYLKYFIEPFKLIERISEKDIEEWTSILTYFYPNVIGEYYKIFINKLKEIAKDFVTKIEDENLVSA